MTENEKKARIFKFFCDPNRLTILRLLQSGEKYACKLVEELHIGQPTLSHQNYCFALRFALLYIIPSMREERGINHDLYRSIQGAY